MVYYVASSVPSCESAFSLPLLAHSESEKLTQEGVAEATGGQLLTVVRVCCTGGSHHASIGIEEHAICRIHLL
jgi:hypothetical protein